jgi:hypothetical protein
VTEKPWLESGFEGLKVSDQWHVRDMSFYSGESEIRDLLMFNISNVGMFFLS